MRRESTLLLTVVFALVMIGVVMIYSASAAYAFAGDRLIRHLIYVAIGLVAFFLAVQFDYRRLAQPFLFRFLVVLSLTLLVAVLIPGIGVARGGAQRWIEIRGFTFQPSELAKFALLVLLAVKLSENQSQLKEFKRGYLPCVLIILTFAALILAERDLGTPVVLCAAAFFMLLMAGAPLRYLVPSVAPAGLAVYLLVITSEYRKKRMMTFLDPWEDGNGGLGDGFQLIQSMNAFVKGAVWGLGPGAGEQKLNYLPASETDFIFAVWGEETGLIGSLVLIGLFMLLLFLSLRIALNAPDLFGTLLAAGVASLISFQAALNMAVATGLLPTKGLPLPFISLGGTSLVVFMGMMGIVINIGAQSEAPRRRSVGPATAQ